MDVDVAVLGKDCALYYALGAENVNAVAFNFCSYRSAFRVGNRIEGGIFLRIRVEFVNAERLLGYFACLYIAFVIIKGNLGGIEGVFTVKLIGESNCTCIG